MSLPWIRLDTAIGDHPKVLALVDAKKHRAVLAYVLGLTYSGRHELDGYVPASALPFIHATKADAASLVEAGMWHQVPGGWRVNGWEDFQISSDEAQKRRERAQTDAARMNCVRWHGKDCGCWRETR